ncbi:hypothetical protein BGZ96_005154 [Linnemannia gamsii]|uniref:Uncharacterized protein n=1 Tax=Linnemannia gamsii TaxID=64522 RepID=A0ABQ7KFR5_9FUNG|nr:hypothetical protein BGZ96_005154 [Linnemannia gamsii]
MSRSGSGAPGGPYQSRHSSGPPLPVASTSSLPAPHPSSNLPNGPTNHSYNFSPYKSASSTPHQAPTSSYSTSNNNNNQNNNQNNNNSNNNQNGPVNSGPSSIGPPTQPSAHQLLQQQQQQIMSAVVDVTKLSWAPEIEMEVQRYREESKKLRQDEDRLMEARRKSRFELERASWDVERQDHLVGLVLGQLEELDREVETDHTSGDHTESFQDTITTMNDLSDRSAMNYSGSQSPPSEQCFWSRYVDDNDCYFINHGFFGYVTVAFKSLGFAAECSGDECYQDLYNNYNK